MIPLVLFLFLTSLPVLCAPDSAPERQRGEGPFERLILRGVIVVNGEGAPPIGPMDVVIEGDRIASIHSVGFPGVPIDESKRPQAKEGDRVMELEAALDEARKQGLGSAMHHAQLDVAHWNVLDSARAGLTTMEHWYGLPEAMFEDQVIQDYPGGYNYANEQDRFGQAGRLWQQAAAPGSEKWNAVRDELIALEFTLNPTLTIYEASRDLMREMNADWQFDYAHPALWSFFQPSRRAHGSYWFDWTTADEIAWKENYRLNDDNQPVRVGGVRYTIKDGIVYDARELLSDVREIVRKAREESGTGPGLDRLPFIPER